MQYFDKTMKVELAASASYTFTDGLHSVPFKNFSVWLRPMSTVTYTYSVKYGDLVQTSGSATAGALTSYNDTAILPPNEPNSNWSRHTEEGVFVVGLPITVTVTNTGTLPAVFLISAISESII